MKNKIIRWLRAIHRDLGFLLVGVCLIYGISGMLLNHMNGKDPAFKTEEKTLQWKPFLTQKELKEQWESQKDLPTLKKIFYVDEDHSRLMLEGGIAVYNSKNGQIDYEKYTRREFVYWINKLHYNKVKGWSPMADLFAGSLIFFALSGIFMVKGKKSLSGSGKWYLLVGIAIPVIYVCLS